MRGLGSSPSGVKNHRGETGSRVRLKIGFRKECQFEPDRWYLFFPPHYTVAHIRTGDNPKDARGILQTPDGWSVLRKCLPADAHIITDSRLTFTMLQRDPRRVTGHSEIGKQSKEDLSQTWSDWCTFRQADTLYYTPSGFSESSVKEGYSSRRDLSLLTLLLTLIVLDVIKLCHGRGGGRG